MHTLCKTYAPQTGVGVSMIIDAYDSLTCSSACSFRAATALKEEIRSTYTITLLYY